MKRISSALTNVIIPLIPMLLWGSLFPMVKIGYRVGGIDTGSVPDIIMFAALRFTLCGTLITAAGCIRREKLAPPKSRSLGGILLMGFFAIVLHYCFSYIGLSTTDSSKSALLKQVGALVYICTAFLFIKEEKFSLFKLIGGVIGFSGIILLNVSGGAVTFTSGDICILCASVCTVVSGILSKRLVKDNPPLLITGFSQLAGGLVLLTAAILMGGGLPQITPAFLLVFGCICAASIGGYVMWTYIQRTFSLSRLYIIKFAEPLFACILGALLLGEDIFRLQYLGAFVLICAGITIGNRRSS